MAIAGIPLGLEFVFLDPSERCVCRVPLGNLLQAEFSDTDAARQLAAMVDVATFDFENVPQETAQALAGDQSHFIHLPEHWAACQDRVVEKEILTGLGDSG